LASFAITTFILNKLLSVTGGGGTPCVNGATKPCGCGGAQRCVAGSWGPCLGSSCGPGTNTFYVKSTIPADNSTNVIRNAKIRFYFNKDVDSSSVNSNTFTVTGSVSGAIAGTRTVNAGQIEFVPDPVAFPCPTNPCGAASCLPAGETITVDAAAAGGVLSVGGLNLACTAGFPCQITFDTGSLIDCSDPSVSLLSSPQVCLNTVNNLGFDASDDSGVSQVVFSDDNGGSAFITPTTVPCPGPGNCGQTPPGPSWVEPVSNGTIQWQPSAPIYSAGTSYTITATADDLDSNQASDSQTITLRAAHCCDGIQNGRETGLDCGGPDCAACQGAACAIDKTGQPASSCDNNLCASAFCSPAGSDAASCAAAGYGAGVSSCCLCQNAPIIDWVTPVADFAGTDQAAPPIRLARPTAIALPFPVLATPPPPTARTAT
jgi:hypothetical protein